MRRELLPMLRLAGPVVLAEIGWMSMGIVDTIMVGPLGPAAIGASGMSNSLFFAVAVFGMGVMLGLDALVAKSYGAGRLDDCVRWLQHGVLVALVVAPTIMLIFYGALTTIAHWGLHPAVRALAQPYMAILGLGALPLLLYATFRRYLQGIHVVRPVMMALVSANLVNAVGNWVLIWGHLGLPALGINGSAWATVVVARLHGRVSRRRDRAGTPEAAATAPCACRSCFDPARVRQLLALGAAGRLAGDARGRRVRRGQRAGRHARSGLARRAPDRAQHRGAGVHGAARPVVGGGGARRPRGRRRRSPPRRSRRVDGARRRRGHHRQRRRVVHRRADADAARLHRAIRRCWRSASRLLAIAAVFQLFDGTQAVATGVLRGVGDTRTPMAPERRSATGCSDCRSAGRSASGTGGASPACGSVCRSG